MTTTLRTRHARSISPSKEKKGKPSNDVVVSIRLSREVLAQIDEIAEDQERSRASVLARAVRSYAEEEYERLLNIRESIRELDEGKGIPHDRVKQMISDLKSGKGWPDELK